MKRPTFFRPAAGFKTFAALFLIGFISLFVMAMKVDQTVQDLWKQLGLTRDAANININVSFAGGHLQYAGAKNAKNLAEGDRVAVVNQLAAYAKKYTGSPEFKSDYKRRQTAAKNDWAKRNPEPQATAVNVAAIKAQEKERLEKQLQTAQENLNHTNPKIKNSAPTAIENIKKQISALDDEANPVIKRKVDEANRINSSLQKQALEAKQMFEAKYPEDPQVLLKKRLQEILDITADVDFAAELKDGYNGKKVFVNPVFERKPKEWKLAYRAGKSVTDAVRAAAQQWLGELNATAVRKPFAEMKSTMHNIPVTK